MICKNCSTEFEGRFCPECGAAAEQENGLEATVMINDAPSVQVVEEAVAQVEQAHVEEAVAVEQEPVQDDVNDYVTETLTPPATVDDGGYYIPPMEEQTEKKSKKKVGIIIAVIIVILAAAFCVVSFTDLVFGKRAQFSSVISDVFGGMDLASATAESENVELSLSADINADNELVKSEFSAEYIEVLNSLGITAKMNMGEDEIKEKIYIYENGEELTNLTGVVDDGAIYVKFGFSDVVCMMPNAMMSSIEDSREIGNMLIEEVKAVFESEDPEKGRYNGKFNLGTEVNALIVTLDEDELDEFAKTISEKSYEIMGLDGSEYDPESSGFEEIRVYALYSGAFSFARKALGIAVEADFKDGRKGEIIYYSNNEDNAVYGIAYEENEESISVLAKDTYTIDGDKQSGTVKLVASGSGADEYNEIFDKLSITYTATEEKLDAQINYFEGSDELRAEISLTGNETRLDATIKAYMNSEEIGAVNIGYGVCDPFEADIDKSQAINIENSENLSTADQIKLAALLSDLTNWTTEHSDSKLVSMIEELYANGGLEGGSSGNELGGDTLEEVLSIREISFTPAQFDTADSVTYYIVDDSIGYVDIQEIGYDGDIVSAVTDTVYFDVSDYSYSEKRDYVESMEEYYEEYDAESDDVAMEFKISGDYVVMKIEMSNLDDLDTYKGFIDDGFIYVEDDVEAAYLDDVIESLVTMGYEEA